MPSLTRSYLALRSALADHYGLPAPTGTSSDDLFAAIIAVSLARAEDLNALRDAGLLDPEALAEADIAEIAGVLRRGGGSSGRRGLGPLRRLACWVADRGGAAALADLSTEAIREALVGLNGIGPPTADAILLFGLRRSAYPVDRATYRILVRHGWLDPSADYDEAREVVLGQEPDPGRLSQLARWLERVGIEFCRPSVARCDGCPLRPFLPEGGPLE